MRLALARARAQPLTGQVRQLAVFARVAVDVCACGCGGRVRLVAEGADVTCVLCEVLVWVSDEMDGTYIGVGPCAV
jgi:hypothetical protein